MKWGHISDALASQIGKMESINFDMFNPHVEKEEFIRLLKVDHEATASEVDDAVEFFVRTGHWPEISDKAKVFLKARIYFAWKITTSISKPLLGQPLPTFNSDLEHHLRWALKDIWEAVGLDCWLIETEWYLDVIKAARRTGLK
jgi:hypothetical protein